MKDTREASKWKKRRKRQKQRQQRRWMEWDELKMFYLELFTSYSCVPLKMYFILYQSIKRLTWGFKGSLASPPWHRTLVKTKKCQKCLNVLSNLTPQTSSRHGTEATAVRCQHGHIVHPLFDLEEVEFCLKFPLRLLLTSSNSTVDGNS